LSSKSRILFTIPNFDTAGSGKALLNIATRLDNNQFEPQICCSHDKGDFFSIVKSSGIPIHIYKTTTDMKPRIKGLVKCWEIALFLKQLKVDLIHSFHYAPDYSEALAARIAGIPWIFTKKNMNWGGKSKNGWKLRSILAGHIVIQNSDMKKQFYPSSTKTILIPRGVNTMEFTPRSKDEMLLDQYSILNNEKVILTVANLVPVKGIEVLMEAFELLYKKYINIHLFIVGDKDNEYAKGLTDNLRKLNSKNRIHFTGKVPNVIDYYSIADIFVLSTLDENRREGSPVALLEAMSCGIQIIASHISGITDILNPFKECMFEPKDPNKLYKKLDNFIMNKDRINKRYRTHILKHYTIDKEVHYHEKLYNKFK